MCPLGFACAQPPVFQTIHITKTCPYIIQKNFSAIEIDNFMGTKFDVFNVFAQNIDRGYTLEPLRRGDSNEYTQSLFWVINKKRGTLWAFSILISSYKCWSFFFLYISSVLL